MIAFLGHWYGYNFQDCLKLPIRLFFKLYEEARIMEARQYKELLLIERINNCSDSFFKYMHDRYLGIIYKEASELPPKPIDPPQVMDAGDTSVKNMLTSYAQKLKRAQGYE